MNASAPIHDYAAGQIDRLLTQLATDLKRTQTKSEPDPIHDLRVGIRRFSQALRIFRDFLPGAEIKPIRKLLKEMMDLTSEVRNRDIALKLISDSKNTKLRQQLRKDRKAYAERFREVVRRWNAESLPAKWRSMLQVRQGSVRQ
ncbi:MAG: CHAD domain-containing protein [Bryobacteraceae bacterium]